MLTLCLTGIALFILWKIFKFLIGNIGPADAAGQGGEDGFLKYGPLIALVLYSFITLLFFYPCLSTINTALIGPPEDNMQHFWNMQWGYKALVEGTASLGYTDRIFYPEGMIMLYNDYSFYNIIAFVPLKMLFGGVSAYNLLILSAFVLAGLGAFLLIRYLTGNTLASLVGGFIFAFNPSHFAFSTKCLTVSSLQFIPFFTLFFIKSIKGHSAKHLVLACLFFLLNGLTGWSNLLFAGSFMAIGYIYLAWRNRKLILAPVLWKSALIIGVTLTVFSPWLLAAAGAAVKYHIYKAGGHDAFVADALAFFTPDPYHRFANGGIIWIMNRLFSGNPWEKTAYLGIANLALIFFTFKLNLNKAAKYYCGLLAFMILAMGASMHVMGVSTPVRLPYALIQAVPFLSQARAPSRNIVFAYLFLSIIAAFSLKGLFYSLKRGRGRIVIVGCITLLIFFDYYRVCRAVTPVTLPACYQILKKDGSAFGILDLPRVYRAENRYMLYQVYHGFPIVQGLVTRSVGAPSRERLDMGDLKAQKMALSRDRTRYIVIHKKFLLPESPYYSYSDLQRFPVDVEAYREEYKAIYEDEDNVVFRVY